MPEPSQPQHPIAEAMQWVARMTAAAVMMVLPGLGGQWVDRKLGTSWVALVGFALGIAVALTYLLAVTSASGRARHHSRIKNNGDSTS